MFTVCSYKSVKTCFSFNWSYLALFFWTVTFWSPVFLVATQIVETLGISYLQTKPE